MLAPFSMEVQLADQSAMQSQIINALLQQDDPFAIAAQRQRNAVQPMNGRQQGPLTWAPEALAMSPIIWGNMISNIAGRAKDQFGF